LNALRQFPTDNASIKPKLIVFIASSSGQAAHAAVSALPRQDLAKMAEALVNLAAFLMRMTADQDETVAEPIDVALLSKGDDFTWIKHKESVRLPGVST
jgi:hypothetical protein